MNKELIVVGDRVLISPYEGDDKTEFGFYLPQGVKEKEKVQSGIVVKTGPGYPIPDLTSPEGESWKLANKKEETKYFPLQAKEGDFCIFLRGSGIGIEFEKKKYVVVPNSAILVLIRGDLDKKLEVLKED